MSRRILSVIAGQWCARLALSLNFLGSVALVLSFQASSSELHFGALHNYFPEGSSQNLGTTSQNYYALCAGGDTLVQSYSKGMVWGTMPCPDFVKKAPVAVVNTEYPTLAFWGLAITALGFLIQFVQLFVPPNEESIEDLRRKLRMLKKIDNLEQ